METTPTLPEWPTVDVVTVSYRDAEHFPRFLTGLSRLDYPFEKMRLFVADNGSTDGAIELLAEWKEKTPFQLSVIECGANLGFGGGSNRGAAEGRADYILFLNPDTLPDPKMVRQLVARAESEQSAGLVEATQVPNPSPKLREAGTNYVDWCSGGVLLARRKAFDELEGFDPLFSPTYCEDVDLSWRMWLEGWRCITEPTAQVINDNNPDGGDIKPNEIFYTAKFSFAMRFIYDSVPGLFRHMIKGVRYLVSPKTDPMRRRGIAQGMGMLVTSFGALRKRRRRTQALLRTSKERERIVFGEWYYGRWEPKGNSRVTAGTKHGTGD